MEMFKAPQDALMFAYRFSEQQYALSPMGKLMKGSIGSGKGLVALEGAGQAGFILEGVSRLGDVEQACITCRYSLRFEPCQCRRYCCNGETILVEYQNALMMIDRLVALPVVGDSAMAHHHKLRHHIIRHYFERRDKARHIESIGKIAERLKVPKRTAYDLKGKIEKALIDIDKTAMTKIDAILEKMCGEQDKN